MGCCRIHGIPEKTLRVVADRQGNARLEKIRTADPLILTIENKA